MRSLTSIRTVAEVAPKADDFGFPTSRVERVFGDVIAVNEVAREHLLFQGFKHRTEKSRKPSQLTAHGRFGDFTFQAGEIFALAMER